MLNQQFLRFLIAGGIAAAANYGSRFIFSQWVGYAWAIVLAYVVGMLVAFIIMRTYVFQAQHKLLAPQVAKFLAVNAFAVLQTLLVSIVLARWVLPAMGIKLHVESLAHLAGVLVPVATSYLGHRATTFK